MRKISKRGVSPVIAVVLLISISLVLALIIFTWSRGFVKEKAQKFGDPVEFACDDIVFSSEAVYSDGQIYINNKGNVPIYGTEIRKKSIGSVKKVEILSGGTLPKGGSGEFVLDSSIGQGDEIIVVPIILGEAGDSKRSHVCDEKFGNTITVI